MRNDKEITKVVAACLMGDASISIDKRSKFGNGGFELSQIEPHIDHLEYIQGYINEITTTTLNLSRVADDNAVICGVNTKQKAMYRLRSKLHPFYTKFRERMYPNGRKVVDPHYIKLLDWQFLAIWYMQDGYITCGQTKQGHFQHSIGIATDCFSYPENMFLRSALKEKFNLDFNVRQVKRRSGITYTLRMQSRDPILRMLEGVKPFVQPSFEYKLDFQGCIDKIRARQAPTENVG
jgi:hypothetical protein